MIDSLIDNITEKRASALKTAERLQANNEFSLQDTSIDFNEISTVANALELVTIVFIVDIFDEGDEDGEKGKMVREYAADAYSIFTVVPLPQEPLKAIRQLLRISLLAVLGDRDKDAAQMLEHTPWPELPLNSYDWGKRTWAIIIVNWLRLIRKKDLNDLDMVLNQVAALRSEQQKYEKEFLDNAGPSAKSTALELIGLYHLAKATEIIAQFFMSGDEKDNYQTRQLLETHFEQALDVCKQAILADLETLALLLKAAAPFMVGNKKDILSDCTNHDLN